MNGRKFIFISEVKDGYTLHRDYALDARIFCDHSTNLGEKLDRILRLSGNIGNGLSAVVPFLFWFPSFNREVL